MLLGLVILIAISFGWWLGSFTITLLTLLGFGVLFLGFWLGSLTKEYTIKRSNTGTGSSGIQPLETAHETDLSDREETIGESPLQGGWLARLLLCSTDEQCYKIQKGRLWFKRIKYMLFLLSFGLFCFAGDVFEEALLIIESKQNEDQPGLLWRWTVGWFKNAPEPKDFIQVLKIYNIIESCIFLIGMMFALRWVYADVRCRRGGTAQFLKILIPVCLCNLCFYFGFHYLFNHFVFDMSSR